MSAKNKSGRYSWLRHGRLVCQIIALALTVLGYFALIRSIGMPKWLFMLSIIVFGLFFCGWLCPFGAVQEWLRAFGKRVLRISWKIPARVDRYLLFSRYVFAFLVTVFALSQLGVVGLMDARKSFVMSVSGRYAGIGALVVLGIFLLASLIIERPYCKYLCGFGAMAGLWSMLRVFGVRRSATVCVGCGGCDRVCGMGVEVSGANNVRDPNCINCGKCVGGCPVPGALTVGFTPWCRADLTALGKKYGISGGRRRSEAETQVMTGGVK